MIPSFAASALLALAQFSVVTLADYTIQDWECTQFDGQGGNLQQFSEYHMNPPGADSCDSSVIISGTYQDQLSAGDSGDFCDQTITYTDIADDGSVGASNNLGESWTCTPSDNDDVVDTCTQGLGGPTCQAINFWNCVAGTCGTPLRRKAATRASIAKRGPKQWQRTDSYPFSAKEILDKAKQRRGLKAKSQMGAR